MTPTVKFDVSATSRPRTTHETVMFVAMAITQVMDLPRDQITSRLKEELNKLRALEGEGEYGQRVFDMDKRRHPGYKHLYRCEPMLRLSSDPDQPGYGTPDEARYDIVNLMFSIAIKVGAKTEEAYEWVDLVMAFLILEAS